MIVLEKLSFERAYEIAALDGRLQLPVTRARGLWKAVLSAPPNAEYWECGVYRGGSARLIAEALKPTVLGEISPPLRLFDTFTGFANVGKYDRPEVKNGRMFHSMEAALEVLRFVEFVYPSVSVHQGEIPGSFSGLENSCIAFANLDLDLYQPTKDALLFILPRMMSGGVIVIDDYNDPDWPGVAEAVNELGVGFRMEVEETQARIYI